ncbi:hypothetical protein KIPB_001093 [Kipferlia bialata]|uniref:Uncharacterized protein n=1 Tax=Kipferlia bialata TaxID=797122 RepID=A0A9K3CQ37_9EUKA|nr:hypothetical protein KIPB_001093 [Kipferlia bialata]|eukprot:g1093.t1
MLSLTPRYSFAVDTTTEIVVFRTTYEATWFFGSGSNLIEKTISYELTGDFTAEDWYRDLTFPAPTDAPAQSTIALRVPGTTTELWSADVATVAPSVRVVRGVYDAALTVGECTIVNASEQFNDDDLPSLTYWATLTKSVGSLSGTVTGSITYTDDCVAYTSQVVDTISVEMPLAHVYNVEFTKTGETSETYTQLVSGGSAEEPARYDTFGDSTYALLGDFPLNGEATVDMRSFDIPTGWQIAETGSLTNAFVASYGLSATCVAVATTGGYTGLTPVSLDTCTPGDVTVDGDTVTMGTSTTRLVIVKDATVDETTPIVDASNTVVYDDVSYVAMGAVLPEATDAPTSSTRLSLLPTGYGKVYTFPAEALRGSLYRLGASCLVLGDGSSVDAITGEVCETSGQLVEVGDYLGTANAEDRVLLSKADTVTAADWSVDGAATPTNPLVFKGMNYAILDDTEGTVPRHMPTGWSLADADTMGFSYVASALAAEDYKCISGAERSVQTVYTTETCEADAAGVSYITIDGEEAAYTESTDSRVVVVQEAELHAKCQVFGAGHVHTNNGHLMTYQGAGEIVVLAHDTTDFLTNFPEASNQSQNYGYDLHMGLAAEGNASVVDSIALKVYNDLTSSTSCTVGVTVESGVVSWFTKENTDAASVDPTMTSDAVSCSGNVDFAQVSVEGDVWTLRATNMIVDGDDKGVVVRAHVVDGSFTFDVSTGYAWPTASGFCGYVEEKNEADRTEDAYAMDLLANELTLDADNRYCTNCAAKLTPTATIFETAPTEVQRNEQSDDLATVTQTCSSTTLEDEYYTMCVIDSGLLNKDYANASVANFESLFDLEWEDERTICPMAAEPVYTYVMGLYEFALLDGGEVLRDMPFGCMANALRVPPGWSVAPKDDSAIAAIRLLPLSSSCVALADGVSYAVGTGLACSDDIVLVTDYPDAPEDEQDDAAVSSLAEMVADNSMPHEDPLGWFWTNSGERLTTSNVELIGDSDVIAINGKLASPVSDDADSEYYAIDITSTTGSAFKSVTVPSHQIKCSTESDLVFRVCAKVSEVDSLTYESIPESDDFSVIIDTTYRNPDMGDDDSEDLHIFGRHGYFDIGVADWQCREVRVPFVHPSLTPTTTTSSDAEKNEYMRDLIFYMNLQYKDWYTGSSITIPDVQFVVLPALVEDVDYIKDPSVSNWFVNDDGTIPIDFEYYGTIGHDLSSDDATLQPASIADGVPAFCDSYDTCVDFNTTVTFGTIYGDDYTGGHAEDEGYLHASALRLSAAATVTTVIDPDQVLGFTLYADILFNDGTASYGWMKYFDDETTDLLLPAQSSTGSGVRSVYVHVLSNSLLDVMRVTSLSLTPDNSVVDIPTETGMAHGDPHLSTLTGYTYDYQLPGEHILLETPYDDGNKLRVDMRAKSVAAEGDEDVTIAQAISIAYNAPDAGYMEDLGLSSWSFGSVLGVEVSDGLKVYFNDVLMSIGSIEPESDTTASYTLDTTGATLAVTMYALTVRDSTLADKDDMIALLELTAVSGLSLSCTINRSTYGIYYIDFAAGAGETFLTENAGNCSGCLGQCTSYDDDEAYIAAKILNESVPEAYVGPVGTSAYLPTQASDALATFSAWTTEEATEACSNLGLTTELTAVCITDAKAMGSLPSNLSAISSSTRYTSSITTAPEVEPTPEPTSYTWFYVGIGALVAVGGIVGAVMLTGGKKGPQKRAGKSSKKVSKKTSKKSSKSKAKKSHKSKRRVDVV